MPSQCSKLVTDKMRSRMTIQTVSRTSDGMGGFDETWIDGDKVWAWINPVSGYEKMQAMQLQTPVSHKITIRYRDLSVAQRLKFNSRIFQIKSITNPNEANQFLELKALEMTA